MWAARRLRRRLRRVWLFVALGAVLVLACAIPIPTVEPLTMIDQTEEVKTADLAGAESAFVRLRLLSEHLTITPGGDPAVMPGAPLLEGRFVYNVQEWAPKLTQETKDGRRRVTINQGVGSQIPLGRNDSYVNQWEIQMARGVPAELEVDMGAGEAQLDLSGLRLTRFALTSGDTDTTLAYSEPNPEPMSMLRLTTGAGKVSATGLGNANFDQASISGGAGSLDLDFHGAYRRSALAQVRAGAGRVTLRLPADIGVRVTLSDISLSQVDTAGLTKQGDNGYVNAAYGQSPLTLTVKVTAGIGAISLICE